MPKKRVISSMDDLEKELNMLPDPESEKDIVIAPKNNLERFFMQKALENDIDFHMGDDDYFDMF
jgi:hypothetical protein